MDRKYTAFIVIALIISIFLLIVDLYLGLIVFVIVIALSMSLFIMQDSRFLPELVAKLSDDAKGVIIRNRGNSTAMHIHVTIVPLNIDFDTPDLKEEEIYIYQHGTMIAEAKAVVNYQSEREEAFSKVFPLSALDADDDDLLKPMFPLFKWK